MDWAKRYGDWGRSGKTQRSYCREAGIGFQEFKQKVGDLIRSGAVISVRKKGKPGKTGFLPITLQGGTGFPEKKPYCEITFREGGRIVIEELGAVAELGKLMGSIRV